MVTETEETQAKEFLRRAEIRTMRKDLRALRETDALKERDKIAKIKTVEEQITEKKKIDASSLVVPVKPTERISNVLNRNEGQEKIAEKDLKNYATEEERQQIFLLESQHLGFEKQIDEIDKQKEPALKLEKNKLLLQRREQQEKLRAVLIEEKKLEDEMKFITEKERTTTIAPQKKSLEQSRWDAEKKIQEVEKKRWAVEKEIQDTDTKINQIDVSSEQNVTAKNELADKISKTDKSLREIYSAVISREEQKRMGVEKEQLAKREVEAEAKLKRNEDVRRQQWSASSNRQDLPTGILKKVPESLKEKFQQEEKQREKFIQDVAGSSKMPPPPPKR